MSLDRGPIREKETVMLVKTLKWPVISLLITGGFHFVETFGFGMILGFGVAARFMVGVYAFSMILFGALIGSGFALSKKESGM
jgi:hypothetical protein